MTRRDGTSDESRKVAPPSAPAGATPAPGASREATGSEVDRQLSALEELAGQLAVQVSYEPMTGVVAGAGGLCRVKGSYRVIIDRRLKPRERAQILVDALRRFDLQALELPADVRGLMGAAEPASPG